MYPRTFFSHAMKHGKKSVRKSMSTLTRAASGASTGQGGTCPPSELLKLDDRREGEVVMTHRASVE